MDKCKDPAEQTSVTYQVVEGKKEQEKRPQVALAPRRHIYFWPIGSGGPDQQQHTGLS